MAITSTELSFDIIKETVEGTTPTTGTRQDLPTPNDQAPLTEDKAQVTDDVRRANRETAAPTDGATSVNGTISTNLRKCAAVDTLIESAISGEFNATTGIAAAGETPVTFTTFTKLTERGSFMGYQDKGCQVTKMTISNSSDSDDSVKTSFEIMGLSRTRLTTKNTLTVTAATSTAFSYIDVGGLKINGVSVDFTDLNFESGTPMTARRVFNQKNATGNVASGNRATTLTVKVPKDSFDLDTAISGGAVPVEFSILKGAAGYVFTLNHAKGVLVDELSDIGLLATITFTAHAPNNTTPALTVKRV